MTDQSDEKSYIYVYSILNRKVWTIYKWLILPVNELWKYKIKLYDV